MDIIVFGENKMKLIKKIETRMELKDFNIFKHQLVKKNTMTNIEHKNWKKETYTNYQNLFVYHYLEDKLILVEIFEE